MRGKKWFILLISLVLVLLSSSIGVTRSSFFDLETSIGSTFQSWTSNLWPQTTQDDFNAGVRTNVDISSSPGDVKLAVKSDWYNTNWQYRRAITIDHTKVQDVANPSTTYANFPVLVYATGLSNIQANGADIRFTLSDGITELPREIESYSAGTLYAWVKVTLTKDASDSSNDIIYMYYGNAAATEPAPDSAYGSQNVWDGNFKFVSHMRDDPDTSNISDSTNNNNDGTKRAANEPIETDGEIVKAQSFDGSDDYIRRSSTSSLNLPTALTISAWLYFTGNGLSSPEYVVSRNTSTLANMQYGAYIRTPQTGGYWGIVINGDTGTNVAYRTWPMNTWVHAVWTWDGSNIRCYFNGGLDGTPAARTGTSTDQGNWFNIGRRSNSVDGTASSYLFMGRIDEVRVSNTARSADWIKTEYNNQNSPSTFCSVGNEEGMYVSSGTIASQVLDTTVTGARWDALFWDETVEAGVTDITFKVRAANTLSGGFPDASWISVGGTSPVTSGLPSGRYMQWEATLTTSDTSKTPTLEAVRVYHY